MKPLAIFPTHVWIEQLGESDLQISNQAICEFLDKAITPRPALQHGRSWQTAQTLHMHPFFASLRDAFINACVKVLEQQAVVYTDIEITGCWANISPPGSLHTPHVHPNNVLSGVYYPRVADGANVIVFHNELKSRAVISPPVKQLNEYNAGEVAVTLESGSLVIFPSTLMHSVPQNRSQQERVSISFNVMFKDFSREVSPPQWEGIQLPE